jgi:hypothetical protein
MAFKLPDPTLKSAVKALSKYSYELFQKEYGAAQRYQKDRQNNIFFMDDFESLLSGHGNARCSNPYCISMNFQCRHEIFACMQSATDKRETDVFSCLNFGSRHLQQHIYVKMECSNDIARIITILGN